MKNELKLGAVISLVTIAVSILIQLIYTPIYMKFLGVTDYGINSLVQTIITYVTLLNLGLGNTIIRYTVHYREQNKLEEEKKLNAMFLIIFLVIMLISIIIGGLIYLKIPNFFANKFTMEELRRTQKVFFITMINTSFSFPISVFSANIFSKEKYLYQKSVSLLKTLLSPILGFILMKNGYGLITIVSMTTIVNLLIGVLDVGYALKLGMRFAFKNINFKLLNEIFKYSIFIFLGLVMDKVYWGVDRILIGKYLGAKIVGVYSIASVFMMVYMSFASNINTLIFPRINKLVLEKNTDNLSKFILEVSRVQYMLLGLISSGFILFGKEFIELWIGEDFQIVYYLVLWIIIPITIPLTQYSYTLVLQAKNKHQIVTIFYFFLAVVNVIGSIYAVKRYGMLGCAGVTGISLVIGHTFILGSYFYKNVDKNITKFWKEIIKLTVLIAIILVVGKVTNSFFNESSFKILIIKISLYIILYLIIIYFWGMNTLEKNEIKKLVKKG